MVGSGAREFVDDAFADESTGVEDGLDAHPATRTAVHNPRPVKNRGDGVFIGTLLH
jgi:hypothetical protein